MGPSEDLAAIEKNTSGFDREAVNYLFWVRAVVPLWRNWATSVASSVIVTADAALFRVAVI